MLKETFITLTEKFSKDDKLIITLWKEIEKNYTKRSRHYHTLLHLDNLLIQLNAVKPEIKNRDAGGSWVA